MSTYNVEGNSTFISPYNGKTMSILGASFDLVNANYSVTATGIWWYKVCQALGMTINTNNSISGSMVCGDPTGSTAGCGTRATSLGTNPDVIMVTLGGNDFSQEKAIGSYDGSQTFPTDGSTFREAYAIMMKKIMETYPLAEVWVQTRPYIYENNGSVGFPEKNDNGVLFKTWNEAIEDMGRLFGAGIIRLDECGMTYFNRSTYAGDYNQSTQKSLHPNDAGHSLMANQIIKQLDPACTTRYIG